MTRGKKIDPLICRAIEILMYYIKPMEIKKVLSLPSRTVYEQIQRVKERKAREEAERIKREINQSSLQPEWKEIKEKESNSFVHNVRRYYS